jgi:hypothetical protein
MDADRGVPDTVPSKERVPEDVPLPDNGPEDASSPGDCGPVLLPEIYVLLATILARSEKKRTLLHLMLASRECYHIGLPELLRSLSAPSTGMTSNRMKAFLQDSQGTAEMPKFRHAKHLQVLPTGYEWKDRFQWATPHIDLLRACLPYVETLALRFFKKDGPLFREVLDSQPQKLKHLSLQLYFVYQLVPPTLRLPPNVTRLDLGLDADMEPDDLLEMLNDPLRAPSLEEVHFSGFWWPNIINLSKYPILASKIRTIRINCRTFQRLRELPPLQLQHLTLEDAFDINPIDWAFVANMDSLASLAMINVPTGSECLTRLPPNLRELTLKLPQPTLEAIGQKEALRASLDSANLIDLAIVCRGNATAVLVENDFWRSLKKAPRVEVIF